MRTFCILISSLICFTGSLRAGSIVRLVYDGVAGTTVANLTGSPIFPNSPTRTQVLTGLLETPANDGDNYGAYLRGWVEAPQTGNYTFWIASDDQSELWLSPDTSPTNKVKIAYESGVSGPRQWDGATGKKSAPIHLVRGQKYYLEVLHKEGGGGDHLAVGWGLPDQALERPMSLLHVQRYMPSNLAPLITQQPQNLSIPAHNTAIFSVAANAAPPPSYQWQQSIDGGVNFVSLPTQNLSYLELKGVPPTANGSLYRVVITNSMGSTTSAIASLTVTADTVSPTILSAAVVELPDCANSLVEVVFSEPMDVATATDRFNYALTKLGFPVDLASATINPLRPERVLLQTVTPLKCGSYDLAVSGVMDLAANFINVGATVNFDTALLGCCNQSYTLNLPAGFSLIANQLDRGGNTVAEVLPVVPDGTALYKFLAAGQTFVQNDFFGGAGWGDPNMTLAPGEGALIVLPLATSITFTGGRVVPSPPVLAGAGYTLLSRQVPEAAGFNELLGFAPVDGSLIVQFDSALQLYRTNYFLNGVWHDQTPIAAVGESVFYAQITPVQITTQPASFANVLPGTDVIFSVVASGTGPLTYQWRRNGNVIPGANQDTYQILNAQPSDGGSYSVSVQNPVGGVSSDEAVLTFSTPPFFFVDNFGTSPTLLQDAQQTLTGNNAGATRQAGEMRHFNKPGGSSVWADWMAPETGIVMFQTLGSTFDTLLAAYTGNTLPTLTEVASDDDVAGFLNSRIYFNAVQGTTYRIAVDGFNQATGTVVLSWDLETTSDTLPVITTQPQTVTVAPGDPVQFTVNATGANLSYQWFRNGDPVAGATSSTYDVAGAQFSDVGSYRVRVFRNGRFIESRTVFLHIFAGGPGTPLQDVHSNDKYFDTVDIADLGPHSAGSGPGRRVQAVVHGYSGQSLFSTVSSTKDVGEPNHAGEPGGKSEWFAFQADTNGTLYVNTDGSSFNTVLAVYIGPGDSYLTLTNVASDNNSGTNGLTSSLHCTATSNTVYWIAVDGVAAAGGSVKLNYRLVVPLTITNVVETTNNNGRITFKVNTTPNLLTKVQASTNLSSTNWTSLLTNTPASGTFNFTNTNTLALPKRFYRAINQF